MTNLANVEVMLPNEAERRLDDLLVFDVRCVDAETRQELLRLLPRLVHLRRAWRAHYMKYGCLGCQKPDPTVAIAARLRRRGATWAEVYEVTGVEVEGSTRAEQQKFWNAVRWKLAHLDVPEPNLSHRYGAGGFCDRCYLRIRRELAKSIRKLHEGRDAAEETAALTRRFDVAQWLLNGEDADFAIGGDLSGSRSRGSRT
jgi:hypothetical protein